MPNEIENKLKKFKISLNHIRNYKGRHVKNPSIKNSNFVDNIAINEEYDNGTINKQVNSLKEILNHKNSKEKTYFRKYY